MANTIFYHSASPDVRTEIDNRQTRYGSKVRAGQLDGVDHDSFLGSKTAYARIKAKPVGGGDTLDSIGYLTNFFEGSLYDTSVPDNIVPNAVLTSVNVRHDGEYGTLQRATVNFKVFNLNQLSRYEKYLLVVGQDVEIDYGWTTTQNNANKGTFKGITYNFSYQLDKDGGFNCTFDAVGEGYYTLGVDPSKGHSGDGAAAVMTDQKLGFTHNAMGIMNDIHSLITKELDGGAFAEGLHAKYKNGIAAFQIGWTTYPTANGEPTEGGNNELQYFVQLGKIVEIMNGWIKKQANKSNVAIKCNGDITLGHMDYWVKSANPAKMVIPTITQADYSTEHILDYTKTAAQDYTVDVGVFISSAAKGQTEATATTTNGQYLFYPTDGAEGLDAQHPTITDSTDTYAVDLSKLLLNTRLVSNLISEHKKASDFFKALFDQIKYLSGGVYDLITYIPDTPDQTNQEVLIINKNWTKISEDVETVVFYPFTTNSVVRDMSLSAQIPDDLATEAYVVGRSTGTKTSTSKYPKFVSNVLTNQEGKPTPPNKFTGANILGTIVVNWIQMTTSNTSVTDMLATNPGWETVMAGAIKQYASAFDHDGKKWHENIPLPLKLSVTLDGINGFKFGDTITTDYLPDKYKTPKGGYKAVFTVTKVNHQIQGQDWTTQLETVCRLTV